MRKGFAPILIILGLFVIIGASAGGFYLYQSYTKPTTQADSQIVTKSSPLPRTNINSPIPTPKDNNDYNLISKNSSKIIDNKNGWKTYSNLEGKYSVDFPSDWTVEDAKENSYAPRHQKGPSVFQNYIVTGDLPGNPVEHVWGNIFIAKSPYFGGPNPPLKLTENDFFNPQSGFWFLSKGVGGGPGTDFYPPSSTYVGKYKAMLQKSNPSTTYEWVSPDDITLNYYIYLGNADNELLSISFEYNDKNNKKSELIKTFNQILSTFKFTE